MLTAYTFTKSEPCSHIAFNIICGCVWEATLQANRVPLHPNMLHCVPRSQKSVFAARITLNLQCVKSASNPEFKFLSVFGTKTSQWLGVRSRQLTRIAAMPTGAVAAGDDVPQTGASGSQPCGFAFQVLPPYSRAVQFCCNLSVKATTAFQYTCRGL